MLNSKVDKLALEKEIERYTSKFGPVLYHYTSMKSFLGMITNRSLWLGNTGSMNDRKEIIYFVEMMQEELGEVRTHEFFDRVYSNIEKQYKYAFCFSREKDDAAQWERYADSAKGVCIGFNVKELAKCLYGYNDLMMNEVFYEDNVKNNLYFILVREYLENQNLGIYQSEEELIKYVIDAGNFHKHYSFKNEHEVRLSTMNNLSQYGTQYELKEMGDIVKKVLILNLDQMGSAKGTSFEKVIDKVIVGPRSQQNAVILTEYIKSKGLLKLANKVIQSECPLR